MRNRTSCELRDARRRVVEGLVDLFGGALTTGDRLNDTPSTTKGASR